MKTTFPRFLKFAPAGKNLRKSGSYCTNIDRLNEGAQYVLVCIYTGLYTNVCVCVCGGGTYVTRKVYLWQQLTLIESECIALFGAYDKSVMNKTLTMLQLW